MKYYACGYTNAGNFRVNNEDAVLVGGKVISDGAVQAVLSAPFVLAVCDGVSGERSGDVASKLCLGELSELSYDSSVNIGKEIMQIHRRIKQEGIVRENSANMQTTLCGLFIDENDNAACVNVGDSRMYRFANGEIRQLSVDQSYGQYLYEHGRIDSMESLPVQYQSAIISSIGSTLNEPEIALTAMVSRLGSTDDDAILIMSDGVSDYVSESELEVGMSLDIPLEEKIEAIAKLALMNGSADNVSIIAVVASSVSEESEVRAITKAETLAAKAELEEDLEALNDILSIDLSKIVNQPKPKPESSEKKPEITPDILMQMAKESLDKLSKL